MSGNPFFDTASKFHSGGKPVKSPTMRHCHVACLDFVGKLIPFPGLPYSYPYPCCNGYWSGGICCNITQNRKVNTSTCRGFLPAVGNRFRGLDLQYCFCSTHSCLRRIPLGPIISPRLPDQTGCSTGMTRNQGGPQATARVQLGHCSPFLSSSMYCSDPCWSGDHIPRDWLGLPAACLACTVGISPFPSSAIRCQRQQATERCRKPLRDAGCEDHV